MPKAITELLILIGANLKVRYRQTAVGFLWVILNPIILFTVQAVLFARILGHLDSGYYYYLLTGLLPWFYLSQTAQMGCNYIRINSGLVRNLSIHPLKLIAGLAAENYINLIAASLLIYLALFIVVGVNLASLFVFILASVYLLILVCLITFIAAIVNVVFRDTNYILHFVFTILYFMTPTFFYTAQLPSEFAAVLKINPFYWVISLFRINDLSVASAEVLGANLLIFLLVLATSFWTWKKLRNRIYLKL